MLTNLYARPIISSHSPQQNQKTGSTQLHFSGQQALPQGFSLTTIPANVFQQFLPLQKSAAGITSLHELTKTLKRYPTPLEFRELIKQRPTPHIGELPPALKNTGLTTHQILERLDHLAIALRYLDGHVSTTEKYGLGTTETQLPPLEIQLGEKIFTCKKVGVGAVGHVYQLSIDGQKYAFKVYNDPERIDTHGAYAETGLAAYLSNFQIKNDVKLLCANPSQSGGWALNEWIGPEKIDEIKNRQGQDLVEFLSNQNLYMTDLWGPNLGPGNVYWDLGGIHPKSKKGLNTLEDFKALFQDPRTKADAGRRLREVRNPEERKAAFAIALADPATRAQAARSAKELSNPEDIYEVLNQALDYPESCGRAAYDLDRAQGNRRTQLFHKALKHPQSAYEAAKMLDKLPEADRLNALLGSLKIPSARGMAARAVPALKTETERSQAIEEALKYPESRFVLLSSEGGAMTERTQALREYLNTYNLELRNSPLK